MACRRNLDSNYGAAVTGYNEIAPVYVARSHESQHDPSRRQPTEPSASALSLFEGHVRQLQASPAVATVAAAIGEALHEHEGANVTMNFYLANNINQQYTVHKESISHAPQPQRELGFQANDPIFKPAHDTEGVDFGKKQVNRWYKAERNATAHQRVIFYNQCSSNAQALSRGLITGLFSHRTKHICVYCDFDDPDQTVQSIFTPHIHFGEFKSVFQKLGGGYEWHRRKIKRENFSMYLYIVKRIGSRFSEHGRQDWSHLLTWAVSLQGTTTGNDVSSALSSMESISSLLQGGLAFAAAVL